MFKHTLIAAPALCLALGVSAHGSIIQGTITDWPESGPVLTIGDNVNPVSIWWSLNTFDKGFFYGSSFPGDSDVAFATGITDVTQIADASIYSFTNSNVGPFSDADADPDGVGDFIVWRHNTTGHYGVLRIDDIFTPTGNLLDARLNATWWFQTDGTSNFVPVPGTLALLALAGLMGTRRRRR